MIKTINKTAILVFPHQLYKHHPALDRKIKIFLVEEFLFFRQYKFHKQKIAFQRASMKFYESYLKGKGYEVEYIESASSLSDIRKLIPFLKESGYNSVRFCEVTDDWLMMRIKKSSSEYGINTVIFPSGLFINSAEELEKYFKGKEKYFHTDFYIHQRKLRNILMDKDKKPLRGKWSFDSDNREKYPQGKKPPATEFPSVNKYYKEAIEYTEKNFSSNYGILSEKYCYPSTFDEAEKWLDSFFKKRFMEFGRYEDAVVAKEHFLHHSVLTPMLNTGLLNPMEVINKAIDFSAGNGIPLNSLEGFVRQILGWREFIRGVYEYGGIKQRTKNFWGFKRKIPRQFWEGNTGIVPLDIVIKKIIDTGYCHHIERLMVLGNFMLLCEFDPDEVYRWFMEMFIDSYDWVMVPNVYGMSQFADGGLMSTKPYISGSNYLMKMGDFPKGEWRNIWDALFWRFMNIHRDFFSGNPRLKMLVTTFDKMPDERKNNIMKTADKYLKSIS